MRLHLFAAATAMLLCSLAAHADTAGVNFTSPGNEGSGSYSLGYAFSTNTSVTVTGLGYFDGGQISSVHQVGLYNSAGTLLASTSVDGTGTQIGMFNFAPITSLVLAAGQTYEVMGSSGSDLYTYYTHGFTVDSEITYLHDEYALGNSLQFGTYTNFDTVAQGGGLFGANIEIGAASTVTPEPSSLALLGTGALGVIGAARRRFAA